MCAFMCVHCSATPGVCGYIICNSECVLFIVECAHCYILIYPNAL